MQYQGAYSDSIESARTLVQAPEGVTIERWGGRLYEGKGFAVGGRVLGAPTINTERTDEESLVKYVARWLDSLEAGTKYVGSWRQGVLLHLDVVDIFDQVWQAEIVAISRGELTYFDFGRNRVVQVNEDRSVFTQEED